MFSDLQVFTTVRYGQTEMCMMIYQGSNPVASRNKLLGQIQLLGLTPAPVGVPRVKVSLRRASSGGAILLNNGAQSAELYIFCSKRDSGDPHAPLLRN